MVRVSCAMHVTMRNRDNKFSCLELHVFFLPPSKNNNSKSQRYPTTYELQTVSRYITKNNSGMSRTIVEHTDPSGNDKRKIKFVKSAQACYSFRLQIVVYVDSECLRQAVVRRIRRSDVAFSLSQAVIPSWESSLRVKGAAPALTAAFHSLRPGTRFTRIFLTGALWRNHYTYTETFCRANLRLDVSTCEEKSGDNWLGNIMRKLRVMSCK